MKWSGNDNYSTPPYLYRALDEEFGFNFDPCPLSDFPEFDGLTEPWRGLRVFVNPPWSNIKPWTDKALKRDAEIAVLLLPARTDTAWFHNLKDCGAELRFFRKRVVFVDQDGQPKERPTDGVLIAIIRTERKLNGNSQTK